jgi:hypothetical protein
MILDWNTIIVDVIKGLAFAGSVWGFIAISQSQQTVLITALEDIAAAVPVVISIISTIHTSNKVAVMKEKIRKGY